MIKRKKISERDIDLAGNAVKVISKESLGLSLKVLKRKMKDNGTIQEYMDRQEFVKPSAKKRRQKQVAINAEKRYRKLYT